MFSTEESLSEYSLADPLRTTVLVRYAQRGYLRPVCVPVLQSGQRGLQPCHLFLQVRHKPLMAVCAKQNKDSRHMHTGYLSFEDISGFPK